MLLCEIPCDPSPNPQATWLLQRRHVEGGPWYVVDRLGSREGVVDWALSPTVALDHGDLVRQLSPKSLVRGFWVRGLGGLLPAGKVPKGLGAHGWDWEAAWEGPGARVQGLLGLANRVDRKRLVLAVCECVETLLGDVPEEEPRPREAIEAARAWTRNEATLADVRRARARAVDASTVAYAAASAAADAAETVYQRASAGASAPSFRAGVKRPRQGMSRACGRGLAFGAWAP